MDIDQRIILLPEDLKIYIYRNFIEHEIFYQKFKTELDSSESQRLNACPIYPYIPLILAKPNYIKHMCLKIPEFKIVYESHKVANSKSFVRMTKGQSFAQSILMYMYH